MSYHLVDQFDDLRRFEEPTRPTIFPLMTRLEAVRCVTWIITGCTFFLFFSMNPWACHLDSSWRILLVLRLAFNSAFRKEHAFLMSMTSFRPLFPLLGFLHWDTRCSFFFFFFFFGEFHTASLTTSTPLSPLPEHTHTHTLLFFSSSWKQTLISLFPNKSRVTSLERGLQTDVGEGGFV